MLLHLFLMGFTMAFQTSDLLPTLWCVLAPVIVVMIILCAIPLLSSLFVMHTATSRTHLFFVHPCGCTCIWSCWSLDRVVSLHDLEGGGWNVEVILLVL